MSLFAIEKERQAIEQGLRAAKTGQLLSELSRRSLTPEDLAAVEGIIGKCHIAIIWPVAIREPKARILIEELSRRSEVGELDLTSEQLDALGEIMAEHGRASFEVPRKDSGCSIGCPVSEKASYTFTGWSGCRLKLSTTNKTWESPADIIPGSRCPWTRNQKRMERLRKEGEDA